MIDIKSETQSTDDEEKRREKLKAIAAKLNQQITSKTSSASALHNQIGVIHRWFHEKNYGFILVDGREYFIHKNDLPEGAKDGSPKYRKFLFDVLDNKSGHSGRASSVREIKNLKGIVADWHWEKRYGFIACGDGKKYFVHQNEILGREKELRKGACVEFDLAINSKTQKLHAEKVKITREAPRIPQAGHDYPRESMRPKRGFSPYENASRYEEPWRPEILEYHPRESVRTPPREIMYEPTDSTVYGELRRDRPVDPYPREDRMYRTPKPMYHPEVSRPSYRNSIRDEYYSGSKTLSPPVEKVRKVRPPPPDFHEYRASIMEREMRKESYTERFAPY